MHYKLANGIVIKSENAAKPATQPSAYLLDSLASLRSVSSSFDYGCGKLRYEKAIIETTDTLAIVDSEIQLSRDQLLRGKSTSIRRVFGASNRIRAYNDTEFSLLRETFDRGFCINVLSVIPSYRKRRHVLKTILSKLAPNAECLFVVQYRNSDFSRMQTMENAAPWLDGFLIDSLRGHSFYGLISPERLEGSLRRTGFSIVRSKLNEGSAYIWAKPKQFMF